MDSPSEIYLTFAGVIDQQSANRFFQALDVAVTNGAKRVHLLIQSIGGTVVDGIAIYNFLTNLPLELVTYNEGSIQSIAMLVYLAGKTRHCACDAGFMIHKTTQSLPAPMNAEMMRAFANANEEFDKKTDAILRQHIKMPDDRWASRDRFDLSINAEDAKQFGLVHVIGHFSPAPGSAMFNIMFNT